MKETYGHVIRDIIYTMVAESKAEIISVEQLITMISGALDISRDDIVKELKNINSEFTNTNAVVGFINGKPVKRTTFYLNTKHILEKVYTKIEKMGITVTPEEMMDNLVLFANK